MSGRRSHPRFSVVNPWNGEIRVLREVVIEHIEDDELLALSHTPVVAGEEMSLDLMTATRTVTVKVKVLESRPVVVGGSMRQRLRLAVVPARRQTVASEDSTGLIDMAKAL